MFHGVERHDGMLAAYDLAGVGDDYAVDPERRNDLGLLALWHPADKPELELVGLQLGYARTELAREKAADWIADRLARACAPLGIALERTAEDRFVVTWPATRRAFQSRADLETSNVRAPRFGALAVVADD